MKNDNLVKKTDQKGVIISSVHSATKSSQQSSRVIQSASQ